MDQAAVIGGKTYWLLEELPSLHSAERYILCVDSDGNKSICTKDIWERSAPPSPEIKTPVHRSSTAQDKIDFFLSTFRGRDDLYAKRYYNVKTGKSGYTPACKNEWQEGICDKKTYRCPECPHREFEPLSSGIVKAHLMGRDPYGRDVAAIYPMLSDDTTWLLAADFDEENWKADVSAFQMVCKEMGLTPAVERSRSGNGAHVWFFFSEPVPAADARRLGTGLLTKTMAQRHELSFKSYDRLFPSQDFLPKGGFGNLIALPFQGQAQKEGNTLFVDRNFEPYPDQWAFLSSLPKITPDEVERYLSELSPDGDVGPLLAADEQKSWPSKRTKKRLAKTDFPIQARLMLSNMLYIDKQGFSNCALNAIKRLAAFPNPEFRQKQAMRLPVYGIPRIISCGDENGDFLCIPRGCFESLTELLEALDVPFSVEDRRTPGRLIDVSFAGTLRPEQKPAAEALLQQDIGVLSATTAFGKTVIGANLIGERKVNTLILVSSTALLSQWKASLEQFLDIKELLPETPKKRGRRKKRYLIGQVGAGKNTRSGIVDIAIMQSLFEGEEKEVKSFVSEYGMVIVDECHHIAAFTFEKVLKAVEAKYVYGLSATPARKDGHHPIIFMQCGPIRYLVDAKSQAEKRAFSHFVIPRFTRTRLHNIAGIQDAYTGITKNELRNKYIISDALEVTLEGRTPILLTERKEHAAAIAAGLTDKVQHVFLLTGSAGQKDKREKLAALQSIPPDESLAVVATGRYIGEGFDAPRLDTLLLTMPVSWKGTLAQYAGRLHRNYEGKQEVRIYDYVDVHVPMLERMYHKRLKGYSELGYQVKLGEPNDTQSRIFGGQEYIVPFSGDLTDAASEIVIASPFIQKNRIISLLPVLKKAISFGVKVTVYTKPAGHYKSEHQSGVLTAISMIEDSGIFVIPIEELQLRLAIIDKSIVWYGNIDFLGFAGGDTDALRFENPDIAGELLSLFDGTPMEEEQLSLPEG